MRHITKTTPPQEFLEYKETPGVSFDGLSGETKKALRQRLLEDQGYICCYCGRRIINNEHTKIEHIKCQENNDESSLDFKNMLASCDGGDNDRSIGVKHQLHCDARKGNRDIPLSPLDDEIENVLSFFEDGTVKGKGEIGRELVRVLGLDAKFLNTERRNAIEQYELRFPENLEYEMSLLNQKDNGYFDEFCFVLEQYVQDLINEKNEKDQRSKEVVTITKAMAVNY